MKEVAILHDKESGDGIEIFSNRNGLVILRMWISKIIFTLQEIKAKWQKGCEAIAMEAQTLPDAINHKGFGDIILDKGHSVNYEIGFQYFNSSK